uniref:Ankyrin repeat domain-containing protein 36A-like isoform X2 n=1 Tax=Petromyzon marinus TaxID=7757 RepID=A0AAJ7U1B6_PETMA|nr:ankyrin repeat domain-containing protein 36A-like isoform X2 [Petromyzon marinus]
MKKIFGLGKRKKGLSPSASETGSVISRYELKDKDLGKLHKAAASGDLDKLKRLLKKGDVNQLDKQNRTPLHLACANGHSDVVLFLLQNNFVKLNLCDNDNRSPLMKAVQCQQEVCVKALLEHKADPTLVDSNGLTALHQAALIPSCPIAQLLLRHNAHIDAENKDGNTPLLLAMSSGDLTMVELLLRHGANVDSRNRARRTPLMIAASNGENEIVKLLLEHGADVSCKDDKGWSAEDHAVIHGHHACSHLIGEQGVRAAQSQLSVGSTGRGPVLPELGAAARLGIPALNKAGEDASHTETLSRTGPTAEEAAGSWCSSDDEDVLDFSPKKPLKPDLSKLLSVSQRLESEGSSNPYPVPDQEFSGESGDERKVSARPLPRASPPSSYSRVPRPSSPSPRLDPFARPRHGHLKAADDEDDEEEEEWEEEDAAGSCSDESLHSGSPRALGPPGPGKHGTRSPHAARRDLMAALGLEEEDAEDGGEDAAEDADGEAAGTGEDEDKEDDEEEDDGQEHGRWSPSDSEFSEAVSDKKEARPLQKPPGQETSSKPLTVLSGNKPNVIDDLGLDDADDLEDASEWDSMGSRSEASHDAGPSPLKPPRAQTAELKGFHAGRDAGEPSQLARRSNHGDTRSNASRPVQEPSGSGSGGSGGDGVGSEAAPRGAAGTTRDARAAGSAGAVGGGHAPASPREPRPPADLEQAALASSSKPPSRFAGALGSAAGRRASLVLPPGKPTAESEPSQSVEICPLKIAKRESSDLSSLSAVKVGGAAAGSGPRTLPSVQTAALVNTSNNNNNSSSSSNLFSSAYIEHPSKIEDKSKVAFDEIGSPGVDPDEDLCETFSSGGTSQREELDVEAITDQKITSDRPGKAAGDAAVRRDFQNGPASLSAQTSGPKPSEIEQGPRHGLAVGRHARDVEQIPEEHQHRSGRRAIGSDGGVRSPPPRPLSDSLAPTKRHTAASKERTARIGVESNDIKTGLAAGLDELTESSDTEDSEGAVIGSLPSSSNPILQGLSIADPAQYARLQAWVFQAQRGLEWEKDRYCLLSDKLKQVETERSAVKKALSEMTRSKEGLEEEKVNLESDLDALRDSLQQERENGRGVATLYEKCQAQLQLKEEQLLLEEKDKRHAEHSLQSVQLEKSIAEQRMQLLEKKLSEIQPDLENERKLRLQQERILDEHLQKQQQSHEERENNSGEELGRPSLALDNSKLQEEISVLNRDMQRQSASFREREELLMNEKNTLLENLEALRRKVNLNEDALQQAVQKYNVELSNAKAAAEENARRLEQETVGRERALEELETVRKQLLRATSERGDGLEENGGPGQPERRQRRRDATELQELLEREGLLSQQLSRTESRCSELESERHRQSLELVEKDHALETCRRELGAARQRAEELDVALRGGREETAKLLVREESQKERMVQAQSDNLLLRQQLQEASAKVLQKEAVVTGIQDRFDDLLSKLQADKNQREQVLEERNQELVASAICLKETLKKLEDEKNNNEDLLHQRKQDLADALKKLAMSEASLDFTVNHRTALEAEKSQLHNNLESQRQQLLEKEREHVRVEQQLQQVQAALQQSRREAAAHAASDHEHACSLDRARRQLQELEDKCQRVEGERSQLEAAVQAHSGTAEALRAQLQRSAQDCKSLEETVKQLSEEKNALEEKLKQIESAMLAASAEKAPELPESDARLSQLSTEKAEVAAKLDEERRRLGEVEGRLEHKSRKYADLQEECNRMKLQIKALKKEREQARLSRSEGDRFLLQGDDPGRHAQEKRLEELTRQLQAAHDTAQSLQRSNRELEEQLRRSKRHLQKQQLSGSVATQAELERHKRELHELARTELASKLQEVNTFLQSQAVSQETLEGLRSMNELHLKRLMEQKLQELEAEVERLRSNAEESQRATEHLQAELRRYTSLYQEELSCRKALSAKLESANERLADMSAHLGSERQRSSQLMSGRLLDNTALAALLPIATTGLRQPQGLLHQPQGLYHQPQGRPPGLSQSLLSYPADSQNSGTFKHAYHTKMQQEMDKIFSRELCQAHAELDGASQRFSPLGAAGDAWERDPVARATSQYVDVLVDRHRI